MTVTALHSLIEQAQHFGSFRSRVARCDAILAEIYRRMNCAPWRRASLIADAVAKFKPIWLRHQLDAALPTGATVLETQLFMACKTLHRLPPATVNGIVKSLRRAGIELCE